MRGKRARKPECSCFEEGWAGTCCPKAIMGSDLRGDRPPRGRSCRDTTAPALCGGVTCGASVHPPGCERTTFPTARLTIQDLVRFVRLIRNGGGRELSALELARKAHARVKSRRNGAVEGHPTGTSTCDKSEPSELSFR